MNSRILLYGFLVLCYMILSARSCNSEQENEMESARLNAFEQSWESLVTDSLGQRTIQAYEEKAVRMVYDLEDYVNLLLDRDIEASFREAAWEQLQALFESEAGLLDLGFGNILDSSNLSIQDYSMISGQSDLHPEHLEFDSVKILHSLEPDFEGAYEGSIEFNVISEQDVLAHEWVKAEYNLRKMGYRDTAGQEKRWKLQFKGVRRLSSKLRVNH